MTARKNQCEIAWRVNIEGETDLRFANPIWIWREHSILGKAISDWPAIAPTNTQAHASMLYTLKFVFFNTLKNIRTYPILRTAICDWIPPSTSTLPGRRRLPPIMFLSNIQCLHTGHTHSG